MAKEAPKKGQEQPLGYEEIVARLEEVVRRLEAGNLSLEDSLKAFEEGIGLVRAGEARLNDADKRVEQLLSGPGGDKVVPFEPEERPAEPKRGRARPEPDEPDDEDAPF